MLVFLPPFLPPYHRFLLIEILIWGLFAMGFNILWGYTGLLSFGQCLYWGTGGYMVAFSVLYFGLDLFSTMLLVILGSGLMAWGTGFFAVRLTGHYFVILTVIFSQVFFFLCLAFKDLTGGDDGISIQAPTVFGLSLENQVVCYYFVLFVVGVCFYACKRFVNSPMGMVLVGIKNNEERCALMGYNTRRYKLISFIAAGVLSGVAGGLYVLALRFTSAHLLHWTVSGDALVPAIVGGAGTLLGPWVGNTLLIYAADILSTWFENHRIAYGLLLVVVVLFAPGGIVGTIQDKLKTRVAKS
jgi:branched-chain amino acid transport system permease protein